MPETKQFFKSRQILVEGRDQVGFFRALLKHMGLIDRFQIQDYGGKTELRGFLKAFVLMPKFESVVSVGVVRDADESNESAFKSVSDSLKNSGLAVPAKPEELAEGVPAACVLIIPSGKTEGMLETVCLESVSQEPVIRCIDSYLGCLEQQLDEMPSNLEKVRLHSFLASRQKPGLKLGEASDAGYWDWDHGCFEPIKAFIRSLNIDD